jgi:hypothetical protein
MPRRRGQSSSDATAKHAVATEAEERVLRTIEKNASLARPPAGDGRIPSPSLSQLPPPALSAAAVGVGRRALSVRCWRWRGRLYPLRGGGACGSLMAAVCFSRRRSTWLCGFHKSAVRWRGGATAGSEAASGARSAQIWGRSGLGRASGP